MKNSDKILSRRKVLDVGMRSLAGAGLLSYLAPLTDAVADSTNSADGRALVCIYLIGGEGDSHLVERSTMVPGGWALHPAATELRALQRAGVLTVLTNETAGLRPDSVATLPGERMAQRYAGLRFLPDGFATPEWAAQLARIQGFDGDGAFTFRGGMSLVSQSAFLGAGDQFENAGIREAMSDLPRLRTTFPDSTLGRQLQDVTRLLRVSGNLGLDRPVFLCTASGFTNGAASAGILADRYRDLSQALGSFHAATVELGIERRVTTYTDAEFSPAQKGRTSARLVFGGATFNTDLSRIGLTADAGQGTLAGWLGLPVSSAGAARA